MDARALLAAPLDELCAEARRLREEGHGVLVTYSPKVFVPLTTLCRDVCHYCTFARPPRRGERAYLSLDEVLDVARAARRAGGDGPPPAPEPRRHVALGPGRAAARLRLDGDHAGDDFGAALAP